MTLLEQCQLWHEQDRHQQIADTLEAIPEEERTPELDLELARAYNNLADPETPEGRELLRQAIALNTYIYSGWRMTTAGISAWATPTTTWIRRARPSGTLSAP